MKTSKSRQLAYLEHRQLLYSQWWYYDVDCAHVLT